MHRLTRYLIALLLLGPMGSGCGPAAQMQGGGDPVPVWGRWQETFTAAESVEEADDVRLLVHLTAPDGEQRTIDGFWDGDDLWKVRFMPDEAGTWPYHTETEPEIAGLHGQEGRFTAAPAEDEANRFLQHGAVKVSDDSRYLAHADGTPFFWLGDTAWNGALKSTDEAWDTYLADRLDKGFTGIQFVTTQWRAADGNAEGEVAYTGFEDIEINPAFFDRIDARIDAVNDAGLLAAPVLLWTLGEPERNPGKLPEDQAIKLARYLVARYGAHHVMFFLAGDEDFSGETGARWRRIGRAVFSAGDPWLATIHPRGRQWHFDRFADEDWLDLIIYQSSHGGGPETLSWLQSGPPAQKWRQEPVRPIINSEPGYEDHVAWERGELHTADDVRRQFYWSLLNAPMAGVTYGAHGIWSWETEPAEPLKHEGSGLAKPWHEALHLPGSRDLAHVSDLFTSLDWWTLRPDQELLQSQPGGDDPTRHVAAARSEAGDLAVVYLPVGGSVTLRPDALRSDLQAEWFNPRTGRRTPAGSAAQRTFTAPDREDWVLVLR